jgi:hypothetical protein
MNLRPALLVTVLAACAPAASEQVRGPDGTMNWYSVTCRRNQANCYEEAGDICPRGYDVADSGGQSGVYMQANRYGATATPTYSGHMLVRCKQGTSP